MAFLTKEEVKKSTDLFEQIASLFRNQTPEGEVPVFTLHRFLSSDPSFAPFAKEFSKIKDPKMVVEIWRGAVRKQKPPKVRYVGPKKVASDELVKKVAELHCLSLIEAEEHIRLLLELTVPRQVYAYYGIDPK